MEKVLLTQCGEYADGIIMEKLIKILLHYLRLHGRQN